MIIIFDQSDEVNMTIGVFSHYWPFPPRPLVLTHKQQSQNIFS